MSSPSTNPSAPQTTPQSQLRSFIVPPPQDTCHLFRPIGSDCSDVIAAHMNMFNREVNAGWFWSMVDECASVVSKSVNGWRKSQESCVSDIRNGTVHNRETVIDGLLPV